MNKIAGIGGRRKADRMKESHAVKDFMAGNKVKHKRKGVRGPRGTYKREEDDIRNAIIKELRKRGVKVRRIENGIGGKSKGIPDLIVHDIYRNVGGFMEVKTKIGRLSTGENSQEEFMKDCVCCYINHWVVRSPEEAVRALGRTV